MAVATALLATGAALSAPVVGTNVLYTLDADFDQGSLVNVNHDAPNNNQLQLNQASGTFPFIWVAASARGTIVKINTTTGAILGEYSTTSDGDFAHDPSRTTVTLDGSAWAGNRNQSSAIHVGLLEAGQCIDRNSNGTIETSSGYGDVKPWPGGSSGSSAPVSAAQDECILHYVDTVGGDARHVTANADGDIWIASTGTRIFKLIDNDTGATLRTEGPFSCGGYGGLIDGAGVIWSATSGGCLMRWDPNAPLVAGSNPLYIFIPEYGLAVDGFGNIWVTALSGNEVRKLSPAGVVLGTFGHGSTYAQGLAVTADNDVWVSSSLFCGSGCTVGHLNNDGSFVGNVAMPTGNGSTGVAVDAAGKVWTANINSSTATRIDPAGAGGVGAVDLTVSLPGASPYNYSDMTGSVLLGSTAPQGTWTVVQDGGAAGTQWGKITWNTEPQGSTPAGTSITVEAKTAETEAGLGSAAFVTVVNGADFVMTGRFIQVRATLRPSPAGASPVLSDIRIQTTAGPAFTPGWMSGEGRLADGAMRLDYAFIVDCDPARTPNFKGRLGAQNLNVTDITANTCTDDPAQVPAMAGAQFDTMEGTGTGTLGATNVLVEFKFLDGGLDNTDDSARIVIKRASDGVVLFTGQAQPIPPFGGGTRLGRNTANPPRP